MSKRHKTVHSVEHQIARSLSYIEEMTLRIESNPRTTHAEKYEHMNCYFNRAREHYNLAMSYYPLETTPLYSSITELNCDNALKALKNGIEDFQLSSKGYRKKEDKIICAEQIALLKKLQLSVENYNDFNFSAPSPSLSAENREAEELAELDFYAESILSLGAGIITDEQKVSDDLRDAAEALSSLRASPGL